MWEWLKDKIWHYGGVNGNIIAPMETKKTTGVLKTIIRLLKRGVK